MSTRSERLKRLQQGESARQRVLSGQYKQPQEAAPISTRANALASYDTQVAEGKASTANADRSDKMMSVQDSSNLRASVELQQNADRSDQMMSTVDSSKLRAEIEAPKIRSRLMPAEDRADLAYSKLGPEKQLQIEREKRYATDPPVIEGIHRGLDKFADFVKPATDIAGTFFTPGAGLTVMNMGTQAAGNLISKVAPGLGKTLGGRVVKTGAQEAIVGAPLGAGQALAATGDERKALEGAMWGAGGGMALGGAGRLIGEGIQSGVKSVLRTYADVAGSQASALDDVAREVLPPTVRRVKRLDQVPEVFPERFRRTIGGTNPAPKVDAPTGSAEPIVLTADNPAVLLNPNGGPRTGPGRLSDLEAAATTQPVQGQRGNYANQRQNGNFSDELNSRIDNTDKSYEVRTNASLVAAANEAVRDLSAAESKFLLNESGGPDHIATGYRLMQELDALGEHGRALVVSKKLAEDLTKSGQTSQAASILARLSPEGQLLNLVRQAEKNGKTVTVADSVKFKDLASKVQERSGAGLRANQVNAILDRLERGENVSVDDIRKLSKFLSNADDVVKPKVKEVTVKDDLPDELKDVRKRDRIVSFLDEAEQAALARIAARKNNLNALPVNEWADHAIVVSAQIAKGAIKAATHVEDMVKLFGEEIRPVATQVFQKAQNMVKGVSGGAAEGNLKKANEAFTRISGVKKETTLQENIVEKYIKENPKVSQKDIDALRELAKNVTRLSGDQRLDADIAMQKILNSYEKSSIWDKTLALRYMGMLLNTHTQMINAASGPIMATTGVVADVFGTMLDIAMRKSPRTTTLYGTNPLRFIAGYMKNLKVGARAGWQGVNPAGIQSANEIRGLAFKSLKNPLSFPFSVAERTLGAVAKGADYATYKTVFDTEIRKQGFLSAKNGGIKGKTNIDKHVREFVNDPPEEAVLQADRIGKNTTFQRADSFGGQAANSINGLHGKFGKYVKPVINAVVPFVRTPINIASTAVTMTPVGLIKGLFQLISSKSNASRREAIRTLSLGITGTGGISVVGYHLEKIGIITGANDSGNKDADNIREQAGQGKYRFNTSALKRYLGTLLNGDGPDEAEKAAQYREGDEQFDYNKLQPLAFPLAIGASLSENRDKPMLQRLGKSGEDAYGSLFGMSTLKGVQNVFQPSYGGTMGEKALGAPARIAESFFKSFSWGGLAQEARRQDPIQRKTPFNDGPVKNTTDYFKSRIPGLSKELPARKTTLGQDYKNAPGAKGSYLNPYRSEVAPYNKAAEIISGIIDRTGDLKLAPSAPAKTVEGKDKTGLRVNLTIPAKRYAKLQEDVGNEIVKRITALPKHDDNKLAEEIEKIYTDVRKSKMDEVKKELGIRVSR